MTKSIIFGKKSKLTESIIKKIRDAQVISITDIDFKKIKLQNRNKVNYIFNNFYPSHKLNDLNSSEYEKFIPTLGNLSFSFVCLFKKYLKTKIIDLEIISSIFTKSVINFFNLVASNCL